MNKTIAVFVQNEVQLQSVDPLVRALLLEKKKLNISLEVLYPSPDYTEEDFKKISIHIENTLKKTNYPIRSIDSLEADHCYDICIIPYLDPRVHARCFLKYEYGTLNIKPKLTYIPDLLWGFHGFLCGSTITATLLNAYGMTFPVDNLRFYKKNLKNFNTRIIPKDAKLQVLFAPTYNDQLSESDYSDIISELKKQYKVIVKGHHGTEYLNSHKNQKNVLKELADEYHGSDIPLSDLILSSDVCLFDNTSAIAEALYAGVPCAIIAKDPDYFALEGVHTSQYHFVRENLIPYTSLASEVSSIIKKSVSQEYIRKESELAASLFPDSYRTGVDGYLSAIRFFLENPSASEYITLQNSIRDKYEAIIEEKNAYIAAQQESLKPFETGKLYRLSSKIYKIKERIINNGKR